MSVSVRTVYNILVGTGYLKEVNERILFLEKIERQLQTKVSLLKKDMKQHYSAMEKIVDTSPYFAHIMNYELIKR